MMISTRAHDLALVTLAIVAACVLPARAQFTPIAQPDVSYLAATTLLPISDPDFSAVSSLTDGTVTVSFDTSLVALTVPTTWASWGAPPDTASTTPRVLWTNGFTSITLTLSAPLTLFGLEAQPNTQVMSPITASFFSGASTVGSIMQNVDGNAGARLFAATSMGSFDRVVLSSTDDFAIAQVRSGSPAPTYTITPTPSQTPTLTPTITPTKTPAGAGGSCASSTDCLVGLFCVDAVCCTSACDGPLQSCRIPPNVGTCSNVTAPAPALSPLGLLIEVGTLVAVGALMLSRRNRDRRARPPNTITDEHGTPR